MNVREFKRALSADLYRYYGRYSFAVFIRALIGGVGAKYTIWLRLAAYLRSKGRCWLPVYYFVRVVQNHYSFKFGIDIPCNAKIGEGLYIGHFGAIVVSPDAVIGKNCNLSQGVTIGMVPRGRGMGCPKIGDNVYIAPGAKIIGKVEIGDNVAIGANCVVTKSFQNYAVVVGVPGRVISYEGSRGYILNTSYDEIVKCGSNE